MQNLFIFLIVVLGFQASATDKTSADKLCTPCVLSSDQDRLNAQQISKISPGRETRKYVFYKVKAMTGRQGERLLWCGGAEELSCEEAVHSCEDKRHLDVGCGAETQKAEAK